MRLSTSIACSLQTCGFALLWIASLLVISATNNQASLAFQATTLLSRTATFISIKEKPCFRHRNFLEQETQSLLHLPQRLIISSKLSTTALSSRRDSNWNSSLSSSSNTPPRRQTKLSFSTTSNTMSESKETIDWIVRPSQLEDADHINSLFQNCYGTLLSKDYDADFLEKALPKICTVRNDLLDCGTWYVVIHPTTNELVGCGGWTPESPRGESVPHLRHFATSPTYTRKGIASSLWRRIRTDVCDHFQSSEDEMPMMEVYSTLTAEPFYKSLGFETIEQLLIPLGDDVSFPSLLMRRKQYSRSKS